MEDKRQYVRFTVKGTVTLQVNNEPPRSVACDLVDICFGGVGCIVDLATPEKITEGATVKLSFSSGSWVEPVNGTGRVKYVKQMTRRGQELLRIGIEFVEIDKKAVQGVIALIQQEICSQARKKN